MQNRKTLYLRRHSLKEGDFIGLKGLELARAEGQLAGKLATQGNIINEVDDSRLPGVRFSRLFHGPLVRTAQTALAFCEGLGYMPNVMPIIHGLGDETMFKEMVNDQFRASQKAGRTNLEALLDSNTRPAVLAFQVKAGRALMQMSRYMEYGEVGIGFFHAPTIELAVCDLVPRADRVAGWDDLKELDGVVIVEEDGRFRVTEVIRAQREVTK